MDVSCSLIHTFSQDKSAPSFSKIENLPQKDNGGFDKTVGYAESLGAEDKTRGYCLLPEEYVVKPVVGWLVCVDGQERGRDWRLVAGRNDIGTSPSSDVVLTSSGIEEDRICSVIYDAKHGEFLIMPGKRQLVYHRDVLLLVPTLLQDGDEIHIGEESLCFQSFCEKTKHYW